jgi:hypothetical protein
MSKRGGGLFPTRESLIKSHVFLAAIDKKQIPTE